MSHKLLIVCGASFAAGAALYNGDLSYAIGFMLISFGTVLDIEK